MAVSGLAAATTPLRKRSQRLSDFTDIAHHVDGQDGVELSSRQQQLLKTSWESTSKKEKSPTAAGEWIMKRLLDKHPEQKVLFGLDLVQKKKVMEEKTFKKHAEKLQDAMNMVVEGSDALDNSLGPLLFSYGAKHATMPTAKGFKEGHWSALSEAMVDYGVNCLKTRSGSRTETLQAWRLLVLFVVTKVRLGFDTEMRAMEALVDRGVHLYPNMDATVVLRKHSANSAVVGGRIDNGISLVVPPTTTSLAGRL